MEPATLGIGVDNSLITAGYDRPSATGAALYVSNKTPSRWYNPAAFVEAPVRDLRQCAERDTIIVAGTFVINGEVHKDFQMPTL